MRRFIISSFLFFYAGSGWANVVGADTQNFNPTPDGLDFVTVQSSETLEPGIFNIGFFLNYAVNSLPNYEDVSTASRTNFADSLLSSDFNIGYGIMRNWSVGLSAPYLLSQEVDSDATAFRGEFAETGVTEYRLNTKFRFVGDQNGGVGTVLTANFNQIENNPFLGVDAGPTFTVELAADTTINKYALGANIGYRFREPGEPLVNVPVEPMDDQFILSGAVSYLLTDFDTKLIGEVFGSFPVNEQEFASDRDVSSMELLLGLKKDFTTQLAFHAGAGTEVYQGSSSPDWRIYTGINWVIGPIIKSDQNVILRVEDNMIVSQEDPFAGVGSGSETFVARDVLFKFDSDEVGEEFEEALVRMAAYLNQPPGFKKLQVEGHTDSVGSNEYNKTLSQRRAESVRRVLINAGLPASKVEAIGYGEDQPIGDNGNYQGRQLNRRVEFNVTRD
jgi:outer membrane protein OmpA-like peptidoglycan-associated protein